MIHRLICIFVVRLQQNPVSHDILKSDGRNFHKQATHFLKKTLQSLHFALSYIDAHSDLGHLSFTYYREPTLGNIALSSKINLI